MVIYRTPPLRDFVGRRFATRSPLVSWLVFERLGGAMAYLLARVRTPPAVAMLAGGATGILGATLLATAEDGGDAAVAAVVLLLAYGFDCSDGQLARATGRTSAMGAWLDVTVDSVVLAFVTVALSQALGADGDPLRGVLVAGAYGATRTASLFTATTVRMSDQGGLELHGLRQTLRTLYVGATDTPVVYVVLCATRPATDLLAVAVVVITVMTVVQTAVSAHHYFATLGEHASPAGSRIG